MSIERNCDYNIDKNAINEFSKDERLAIYRSMARLRYFEDTLVKVAKGGRFAIKIHMASGQESVGAAVALINRDYQIFTQHRSTDLYLALGGNPEKLRDEMLCKSTGCSNGNIGGAFQNFENGCNMYAHTGLIGENISVGVGAALGNKKKTLCYFGDGAAEEDYALQAYGFAVTHKLPVMFVCTDNDLSVLSPLKKRRTWNLVDVAKGFGMEAIDIADDPFSLAKHLRHFDTRLPALINCRTGRNYWHAGVGIDNEPEWDRFKIVKQQLTDLGYVSDLEEIDNEELTNMENVWKAYL